MEATVSSKFQITIPAKLRKKIHLRPSMKLFFNEQASALQAKPKYEFDVKFVRRALGSTKNLELGKTST